MNRVILLTGATGSLGTQIARRFIQATDSVIVALVRAPNPEEATGRLKRAWWDWPDLTALLGSRIVAVPGDVSLRDLGMPSNAYNDLIHRVSTVVHAAADLRLDAPIAELRRTNVQGTVHVLEFVRAVQREHGLERLTHISTAYVCGGRQGEIREDELNDTFGFSNAYERSKYEGELLAREARSELPISIVRPGMIVGDSLTGAIKTFNTVYVPLRLYLSGKLRIVPARRDQPVNVVPVDYVADAIVRLTLDPSAAGQTFHLTAPRAAQPTIGELINYVGAWAKEHLGSRPPRPVFLPPPAALQRHFPERLAPAKRGSALSTLMTLWPYFNDGRCFRRDNTDRLLGSYSLNWRDLLPRLLEYGVSKSFLHRSERTVHEQILFRLQSETRPVTFHDLVEGAVQSRSGSDLRQEMLAAARALRALDVQPGDRIAIVGLNSSRYLTLDTAIGLVGGVSVPLYYTSPVAEIDALLRASGARLLLAGVPKLLGKLGELNASLPIISFCRGPLPTDLPREVITWEQFLALAAGSTEIGNSPAVPEDIATLRYTSGTTGPPKGVVFTQRQLRWMAETIASLLPWEVRTGGATYLSFLPMNHVVEGILGTYSPYYLPAGIDISFLEDLRDLPRALPMVRPTIFFAVPRVYEKLWDRLRTSSVGRSYLASSGLRRRLLQPVIRRQILKRAGFNRCAWLIVGSAPANLTLLQSFRELGIEIHNAYGLTEAPLVTINRPGANQLGTTGQPLPSTEIRLAEDGEIVVKGPQVTSGYFDHEVEPPLQDGWLRTGDLGHLTPEGSLVIEGRKKALIATSYGKKIQASKVEALLQAIPEIGEAMVVGEGRPYCVALLWVGDAESGDWGWIDQAIIDMNSRLSHPEQVRRWAILDNDLSIEGGDLTANLKLKRQVVARRYQPVIDALYGEGECCAKVLHLGCVPREERVLV